jgi:hypothetical protein
MPHNAPSDGRDEQRAALGPIPGAEKRVPRYPALNARATPGMFCGFPTNSDAKISMQGTMTSVSQPPRTTASGIS